MHCVQYTMYIGHTIAPLSFSLLDVIFSFHGVMNKHFHYPAIMDKNSVKQHRVKRKSSVYTVHSIFVLSV